MVYFTNNMFWHPGQTEFPHILIDIFSVSGRLRLKLSRRLKFVRTVVSVPGDSPDSRDAQYPRK